jgi:hypothetical protein
VEVPDRQKRKMFSSKTTLNLLKSEDAKLFDLVHALEQGWSMTKDH